MTVGRQWRKLFMLMCTGVSAVAWAQTPTVTGFDVQGNTLLPLEKVSEVLANFQGPQSLDGLKSAATALQQAYRDRGYGAVVVTLPAQTIADGRFTLLVTEGKLGQVQVTGARQFSADNIRRSLPGLKEQTTPNLIELDAQSLLANENPAKHVRLVFQPGLRVGEVDLVIATTEQPVSETTLAMDNTGRPDSGTWRASVSHSNANVSDRDHVLRMRVESALSHPTRNPVFSGSYRVPVYTRSGALEFNLTHSKSATQAIPTPAGDLSYSGQGSAAGVRYQWFLPQAGEAKRQLGFGADIRHYQNECQVGNLGSAGCGSAQNSVGVRPVVLTYLEQTAGKYSAQATLSSNALAGGRNGDVASFETTRTGATRRYTVWRGQWQSVHPTGDAHWVQLKVNAQASPHALIPAEQFGAGGSATVRGYLDRELVGDQGLALSADWTFNAAGWLASSGGLPPGQGLLVNLFADTAQVSNRLGSQCMTGVTRCRLGSVGIGLQWSSARAWALKAEWGHALKAGPSTARRQNRLHVSYNLYF